MKKSVNTLLIGVTLVLGISGQAWAQKKVIIGNFGDPAPYEAAVAEGKFEKATGWTIEWRKFNSGAEVNAAMAAGAIQISEIGSTPLSAGASQGVDYELFLIGKSIDSAESLIVRNGAGIDKPSDLKGKKIAVPVGSTAHFSLMGALKHWGISEKDAQVIGMSPPEINAAWTQNAIDAAFIWEPVQTQLRANGKRMVTAGEVGSWGFPTFNGWVVNSRFANENQTGMVAFVKVMNDVNERYARERASWTADSAPIKAIASRTGSTPEAIATALSGEKYPTGAEQNTPQWMGGAGKAIKSTADFLKAAGRINSVAGDYNKYVNTRFTNAAAAK